MRHTIDDEKKPSGSGARVIGFDMDGVFIDFSGLKQRIAKERGFDVSLEETASEVYETKIPEHELLDIKHHIYNADGLHFLAAPLVPGARESVERVMASGVPFALISRRRSAEAAQALLEKHGLWPRYFSEKNAFFVREPADKDAVAERLGVTHFVDDEQKVLDAIPSVAHRFLFDPLGAFKDSARYPRVESWRELLAHLLA